ncbi:MAG TPA: hypothetical protein VF117_05265 [Gammaproteobacteria bacterium]
MKMRGLSVHKADPAANKAAVRQVVDEVFAHERGATVAEEWDNLDAMCPYVRAFDRLERPIGTGQIGCMAMLAEARQPGLQQAFLHAQMRAISFYSRHGFVIHGAEFMEANILHRQVTCRLQ